MQVKFTRNVGSKGMLMKKKSYQLRAFVSASPEESNLLDKYGYWAEMTGKHTPPREHPYDPLGSVSLRKLAAGVDLESDTMPGIFEMEERLIHACQNIINMAYARDSFDGTERVFDLTGDKPVVVAQV